MSSKSIQTFIENLVLSANIKINGDNPWDVRVNDDNLYTRIIHQGTLGFGEAYMDGWWDCDQLDEFINRVISARLEEKVTATGNTLIKLALAKLNFIRTFLINRQSKKRALIVGKHHYDIGNDLYKVMLDDDMNYTCGYWKNAKTLNQAQQAKLKLVCDKLYLKPGMKVLDIGCGWGGFAKFAAKNYQVHVVGITISEQQIELGKKHCQGLPVELRFQDYRDVKEKYDRIVSLGMFEHVGYKNYNTYLTKAHHYLNDDGLFLLHTIGKNTSSLTADPWISKYIFPNGYIPSIKQIASACENLFVVEDWHNFGADYDKTLIAWYKNFTNHWDKLKDNYSERFYRMWRYYLLACAGNFRARSNQLWQIVLSKQGVPGGYQSVR